MLIQLQNTTAILMLILIIDINVPTRSALVLETKSGFCKSRSFRDLHRFSRPNLDASILDIKQDAD